MAPPLHIRLLGEFGLARGDEPVASVTAPRLQALIAYLALGGSAPQPRAHTAFVFWPDSTEKQALTNLRHLLHRLRQALPDADVYIHADAQSLRLKEAATLDVDAFRSALAQAEAARTKEDSPQELQHLLQATDLYRGDLLPSCYDGWIEEDRRRLRQHYAEALDALIRLLEARREYAAAIRFARRQQQHEPLREPTYRTLMRLHALAGDRAGVLGAYDECREMMDSEFGSEPSDATTKLHGQLLDGQGTAAVATSVAGGEHPLVGRFREWERLKNSWRRTREEGSRLVAVCGEAGIGKTRLVEEFVLWTRRQGAAAAWTRSYAAAGRLAYAPVVDWLRSDALGPGLRELDDIWLAEIARILPELRLEHPDLPAAQPVSDGWERRRLFDALTRAVRACPSPVLLVLDDLQWTDQPTLEWLRYLLRQAGDDQLLVAVTIRNEEIEPDLEALLVDFRMDGQLEEISLGPLEVRDSAAIARHMAGRELDDEEAGRLQAETEGNPLFVVETVRMRMQEDRWQPTLSPKVQAVISRRLHQLSPQAAETAALAAVVGRAFSADVLARAGRHAPEDLAGALDELWRRRIIEEQSVGRYDFTHDKLREVAYGELSPERRRLLHLGVARALEAGSSEEGSIDVHLAAHYEQAGRFDEAATRFKKAADAARLVYAGSEAARLYRRALDLLATLPATPERARRELEMQTALGACLVAIRGYPAPEVRQAYERARALCRELEEPLDAPILRGMALSNVSGGDLDEARRLGEELIGLAEAEGDPVLSVEGRYVLGVTAFWQGRLPSSREHLEAAIKRYDPARRRTHTSLYAQDPGLVCRCRLALTHWYLGEASRTTAEQSIEEARSLGHPHTLAYVLCFGTHLILDAQAPEQAEALTHEAQAVAAKHDFSMWHALATIQQGWTRADTGALEAGAEQMRTAMEAYRNIDNILLMPQYLAVLSDLYRRMGSLNEARAALREAFAILDRRGERYYEAELLRLRGELLLAESETEAEAEAALRRALAVAVEDGARFLQLRAATSLFRWLRRMQRADEARRVLREACAALPDDADTPDRREARALLESMG